MLSGLRAAKKRFSAWRNWQQRIWQLQQNMYAMTRGLKPLDHRFDGIAVIIPALNEAKQIGGLLETLSQSGFDEIIVADGGSSDDTAAIVATFPQVQFIQSKCGRGPQINTGVRTSKASDVVILHADTRLPPNAAALIRNTLSNNAVAGGCFRLKFDQPARLLRIYEWFSRFETSFTTFGDQAFFMRRSVFDAIDGAPDWPFLEDVVLRDRIRSVGFFQKRPEAVVTSARRFVRRGPLLCQLRNIAVIAGFRCGMSIKALARFYGAAQTGT